jgi:hypothetical protein
MHPEPGARLRPGSARGLSWRDRRQTDWLTWRDGLPLRSDKTVRGRTHKGDDCARDSDPKP